MRGARSLPILTTNDSVGRNGRNVMGRLVKRDVWKKEKKMRKIVARNRDVIVISSQ